jgi:ferrous iron transport protein B
MDTLMHRIGLHGKSFVPMLIGFGCTVPAILATRMLESRRDRLSTMLVLPLFSCGARLPIYTLFIGALFAPRVRTPMLMAMYLIGVATAVLLARLLRRTLFRGEPDAFVMDLPPYRAPTWCGLGQHVWERGWLFVRKAGTVIVAVSCVMWALNTYPKPPPARLEVLSAGEAARARLSASAAGTVGRALAPVLRPIGFDWKASTALIGALAAKEVFVSQLGILNAMDGGGAGSEPLRAALRRDYTPLQGFCIMLFCLMSVPCISTLVATRRESGSWRWPALQFGGLTAVAYVATFLVYQGGRLAARALG